MSPAERPASATLGPCADCGGQQVGNLRAGTYLAPRRSWRRNLCGLGAVACLGCGLVRLYADGLRTLRWYVEKEPDKFSW